MRENTEKMVECISIRLNIWASLLEGTVKRERVGEDGGPRVTIGLVTCSAGELNRC